MPLTVFVMDGDERPALAIVRALGRRGASVLVGHDRPLSLAHSSRYCARRITYPSPQRERGGFDRFLMNFLSRERVDIVLPVTDVTTHAVCANQAAIRRHAAVVVPPLDAFDVVSDKGALIGRAAEQGVPVPRSLFVTGLTGLNDVLANVQYPAVIKPTRSRIAVDSGWLATTVHYAYSEKELRRLYRDIPYLSAYPSLIQERIVGPGIGAFLLFDRGRIVAEFAHRRLREKPPAGGVSVLRESIEMDPRLREYAKRVLEPLSWHGVAMMEYKQRATTGELFLMEVNGRFWGSLQLAIDAGIDFPNLACDLALDRVPIVPPAYQPGVKSRWLLGDLDHLCLRLFKSDEELRLPVHAPSRLRACLDFAKFVQPNLHYEVLRRNDWRPFAYELWKYVKGLWSAAARRILTRVRRRERPPVTASRQAAGHTR